MSFYIGIDIGGTKTAYGLFDHSKKMVAKKKTSTNTELDAAAFFDAVCDEILRFLKERQISLSDVAGVGVGLPSFINFEQGYIVKTGSIPQLHHFYLRDYLKRKLGNDIKIVIDNDGNTGALAEFIYGAGQGHDHMIFCLISTGIGSSIIINKTLFRGSYGGAGESGHMLTLPSVGLKASCGCNNAGCFNSICSGKMILNYVKQWIRDGERTVMTDLAGSADKITTEHIDTAYEMGDAVAKKAVEQMAQYMAVWLYNMYLMLNIKCFVFSGGLLYMGEKLLGRIKELFEQYNDMEYPVYFLEAKLGDDFGIIGAMELLFLK